MRLAITGAAGFIGRAVIRQLREGGFAGEVMLIDRAFATQPPYPVVQVDLTARAALAEAVEGADCVIHLAALPGAAAEADPASSRRLNLELPLDLIELMEGRRLVCAGSVAVFGSEFPTQVDQHTPPRPDSVYGTHKWMVELAFSDAVRRGALAGFMLRLPGIVARPPGAQGFGSAFLSEMFHAIREGRQYLVPVAPDATSWLMSARTCAANLVHAALSPCSSAAPLTPPTLTVRIGGLVEELGRQGDVSGISFAEDALLRRQFASHPPLDASAAEAFGFKSDASLRSLVDNALDVDARVASLT